MLLLIDSREQAALVFEKVAGVETKVVCLPVGDYGAEINGVREPIVIERKEIGDLFSSFSTGYVRERAKILRAKELGLKYILAIEVTASDVYKGHTYWKNGKEHKSKKSGLAMLRQLMMLMHKYGIEVWYCDGRREMSRRIMEYFLAAERLANDREKMVGV